MWFWLNLCVFFSSVNRWQRRKSGFDQQELFRFWALKVNDHWYSVSCHILPKNRKPFGLGLLQLREKQWQTQSKRGMRKKTARPIEFEVAIHDFTYLSIFHGSCVKLPSFSNIFTTFPFISRMTTPSSQNFMKEKSCGKDWESLYSLQRTGFL